MCSISGLDYDYYKKNITGVYEITDGGGSTMINGVINCNIKPNPNPNPINNLLTDG